MRTFLLLICISTFKAYSQDCHIPAIDYGPKEIVGNYSVYQFTPKTGKDSILLITATYDSILLIETKTMYAKVHTMAGLHKDAGIDKIKFDVYKNVLCQKMYAEGERYDGRYKYIELNEWAYDDEGYLLS